MDWAAWARSEIARLVARRWFAYGRGSGKSWTQYQELRRYFK